MVFHIGCFLPHRLFFTWNSEKFTAITCFFKNYPYLCVPLHKKTGVGEIKFDIGEMAEWSNAAVLKTVDLNGSGGSNPSLSAINIENQCFTKLVHEFVHESPIFGAFFMPFSE